MKKTFKGRASKLLVLLLALSLILSLFTAFGSAAEEEAKGESITATKTYESFSGTITAERQEAYAITNGAEISIVGKGEGNKASVSDYAEYLLGDAQILDFTSADAPDFLVFDFDTKTTGSYPSGLQMYLLTRKNDEKESDAGASGTVTFAAAEGGVTINCGDVSGTAKYNESGYAHFTLVLAINHTTPSASTISVYANGEFAGRKTEGLTSEAALVKKIRIFMGTKDSPAATENAYFDNFKFRHVSKGEEITRSDLAAVAAGGDLTGWKNWEYGEFVPGDEPVINSNSLTEFTFSGRGTVYDFNAGDTLQIVGNGGAMGTSNYVDLAPGSNIATSAIANIPDYIIVDFDTKTSGDYPTGMVGQFSGKNTDDKTFGIGAISLAASGTTGVTVSAGGVSGTVAYQEDGYAHITLVFNLNQENHTKSTLTLYGNGEYIGTMPRASVYQIASIASYRFFIANHNGTTSDAENATFDNFKFRTAYKMADPVKGDLYSSLSNYEALTTWKGWGYGTYEEGAEPRYPLFEAVYNTHYYLNYYTVEELATVLSSSTAYNVKLLGNVNANINGDSTKFTVAGTKTLDLNSFAISQTGCKGALFSLSNNSNFTIKNGDVVRGDGTNTVDAAQCFTSADSKVTLLAEKIDFTTDAMFAQIRGKANSTSSFTYNDCSFNILRSKNVFTVRGPETSSIEFNLNNCTVNAMAGGTLLGYDSANDNTTLNTVKISGGEYKLASTFCKLREVATVTLTDGVKLSATTLLDGKASYVLADGVKLSGEPDAANMTLGLNGGSAFVANKDADGNTYPIVVGIPPIKTFANLTLNSNLDVNFFFPVDQGVATVNGTAVAELEKVTAKGVECYAYAVKSVAAATSLDKITVTVVTEAGNETVISLSVMDYVKAILESTEADCVAAHQLMVDLVNYVKLSYNYFAAELGYDETALAAYNEALDALLGLTDLTPTAFDSEEVRTALGNEEATDVTDIEDYVTGAYLDLSASGVKFAFDTMEVFNYTVKVNGLTVSEGVSEDGSPFTAELHVYDLRDVITIEVVYEEETFVGTYSLYTYLSSGEVQVKAPELVEALYVYSVTAEAYDAAKAN